MVNSSPLPFFRNPSVKEAINELGGPNCRRLLLVVGAGASNESGLPLWQELIRRLVHETLRRTDPENPRPDEDYKRLTQEVLDREGLLGAATIARQALGNNFPAALCDSLYHHPDDRLSDGPGPLALAAARIFRAFRENGDTVNVITTNYDDLLERALHEELDLPVTAATSLEELEDEGIHVLHAHGVLLPKGRAEGELILSEADYHRTAERASWQERYFKDRLLDSHVLFVGSSLTDPNLLRFLFRYEHPENNVHAVLVQPPDPQAPPDVVRKTNASDQWQTNLSLLRWESMGVNVLKADYFGQPSQFLFEVAQRKAAGDSYRPYGDRLDDWFVGWTDRIVGIRSADDFEFSQQLHNQIAKEALDVLVKNLSLSPSKDEVVVLHLWARSPGPLQIGPLKKKKVGLDSITMIVCSDRQWTTPSAADCRRISMPTRRAAVEAFCHGVPRVHEQPEPTHQWNFVLAVPIIIDSATGRLPVGSVTLNSNLAGPDSCLAHLRQRDWQDFLLLARYLQDWGADLLNPSP